MTTIVLTILGILLASASALMVVYYGGDAFASGSTGAGANTLQNAGSNVQSASAMYRMTNGAAPTSLSDLTDGQVYMPEAPSIDGAGASSHIASGFYDVTGVSEEVCREINKNLDKAFTDSSAIPTARDVSANMGCFDPTGSATESDANFYAKL